MRATVFAFAFAVAVVVSVAGSVPAWGTPWDAKNADAKAEMKKGVDAFQAQDYALAAAAFVRAWDLEHHLKARWSAAQAYAAGGDWARARTLLDALVADPTWPGDKRADLEARARVAVAFVTAGDLARNGRFVEARDAYLVIEADVSVGEVTRGQAKAAADALSAKLARDAEERQRAQHAPPRVEDTPPPAPASAPPPAERVRHGRDWLGWSAVGAGAALMAAGGGFMWHADALYERAATQHNEGANRDLRDRADTQRIGGQVALGVGAAVVVVGVVKLVALKPTRTASVALAPRAGGGVLVLGGRF